MSKTKNTGNFALVQTRCTICNFLKMHGIGKDKTKKSLDSEERHQTYSIHLVKRKLFPRVTYLHVWKPDTKACSVVNRHC